MDKETDGVDIEQLRANSPVSIRGQTWVQRGTQLECTSLPFSFSIHIPPNLKYIGLNEKGEPDFEKIF